MTQSKKLTTKLLWKPHIFLYNVDGLKLWTLRYANPTITKSTRARAKIQSFNTWATQYVIEKNKMLH